MSKKPDKKKRWKSLPTELPPLILRHTAEGVILEATRKLFVKKAKRMRELQRKWASDICSGADYCEMQEAEREFDEFLGLK